MKYKLGYKKKKFIPEVFSEIDICRIIACEDIYQDGKIIVKKGEAGGWIQSTNNLAQTGSCWIFEESIVVGNSVVMDEATVVSSTIIDSKITNNSTIIDSKIIASNIFNNSNIHSSHITNSFIYNNAQIDSSVVHNSSVTDNALIEDLAEVSNSVISKNAKILHHSFVDKSTIGDDVEISAFSKIEHSTCSGTVSVKDVCIKDSTIALTGTSHFSSTFSEDKLNIISSTIEGNDIRILQKTLISFCDIRINNLTPALHSLLFGNVNLISATLTDDSMSHCAVFPKKGMTSKRKISAFADFSCDTYGTPSITISFPSFIKEKMKIPNKNCFFPSYTLLEKYLIKNLPITEPETSLEHKMIARYIKNLFEYNEAESFASVQAENFFKYLSKYWGKDKVMIEKDKETIIEQLKAYFFFSLVELYLVVATEPKEKPNFFLFDKESCNSFIEKCSVNFKSNKIDDFCPALILDGCICETFCTMHGIPEKATYLHSMLASVKNAYFWHLSD